MLALHIQYARGLAVESVVADVKNVARECELLFSILVHNVAYQKEVFIHGSKNHWATSEDAAAVYVGSPIWSLDRFAARVPLPPPDVMPTSERLEKGNV